MLNKSFETEAPDVETKANLEARDRRERAAINFHGPVFPASVEVNGRERKVLGKSLATLMKDAALLAPPEIVIPFIAAVGRITMLAAREKAGKSTLAAFIAAVVSCGRELWGHEVKQGVVVWVGLEEEQGDAVRRFSEMNADAQLMRLVGPFQVDDAIAQIEAEIVAHDARLVVIDSLAAFFKEVDDENGAAGWTKHLLPLVALARKHRTAIVLLHHANRAQGTYRGSSAIGAAMDMILEMSEDEKDSSVRHVRPRGRWTVKPFSLRYEPTREFSLIGDETPSLEAQRAAKRDTLLEKIHRWLLELGRPASLSELRKAAGTRASLCDEALGALVAAGRVRHLGKRQGYEAVGGREIAEVTPKPSGNRARKDHQRDGQLDIGL